MTETSISHFISLLGTQNIRQFQGNDYCHETASVLNSLTEPAALVMIGRNSFMKDEPGTGICPQNWAREALLGNDLLAQVLLTGVDDDSELDFVDLIFDGVLSITAEDLRGKKDILPLEVKEVLSLLEPGVPVFYSICSDVFSKEVAGNLSFPQFELIVEEISRKHKVLGADLFGFPED